MAAAGVGITPIRALLKHLEEDVSRPISLGYAAEDNHLFWEDLEAIAQEHGSDAWYFVSESEGFIWGMKDAVIGAGVKKKKFINDPFLGY